MIEILPFCPEWPEYVGRTRDERYAYVAGELRRLEREGLPILRAVLATFDDHLSQHALDLLHGAVDPPDGASLFESGPRAAWPVRLVKGAKPPSTDPQGRPVKTKGTLVAKVGNLGGKLGPDARPEDLARYNGDARRIAAQAGRDLYRVVEIDAKGRNLSLADALAVLRAWGYGCQLRRYQRGKDHELAAWKASGADPDKAPRGQDLWLVEEICAQPLAATGT